MNNNADRLTIAGFIASLLVMSLLFWILPKEEFSDTENRVLQKKPQWSWDQLWSKQLSEQTELYLSDHFPFRDQWVALKSGMEQLRLQQENNGIYKGKHGYLLERFEKPDYDMLQQFTNAVKQFAAKHPQTNMTFMLAPTSVGIYPERLPWLASVYSQATVNEYVGDQLGNRLGYINGFDFLSPAEHGQTPIYYRTDHHWTTYGAYLAYTAYAEHMGWNAKEPKEFNIETVTDSFLGSYHTRSQFIGVQADSIERYVPKHPVNFSMYIADTDQTVSGLYDNSYLETKDKYSYFLGGVHALMTIHSDISPAEADQQKLLVIKDSYAHSVLPFLALHVPEIHVMDLRYYNGNVGEYMEQNEIKDVLMLFNTSTFVENRELLKLAAS